MKKTTTKAAKKPAEKKPVVKKVAAKSAVEKTPVPKKAAAKNVKPASRREDSPAAKKQPKPVFSIFDETAKKFVPAEGAKPISIPGLSLPAVYPPDQGRPHLVRKRSVQRWTAGDWLEAGGGGADGKRDAEQTRQGGNP